MLIAEGTLRRIIQEELEQLDEAIRNRHGYSVRTKEDVEWTPSKRNIPFERNPFVGSSPAFNSWYNDGDMTRPWKRDFESKTGDVKSIFGKNDIYFNKGDHVIIPMLHGYDEAYTNPGTIASVHHKDPSALGVPGVRPGDTIPLVDIMFPATKDSPPRWLHNVGFAFMVHLGGPNMRDPWSAANYALRRHRDGIGAQREKDERAAEREERRAARAERNPPPPPAAPEPPRSPPPGAIRRVGGVAAPPPPKKPQKMTDDEVRSSLGLPRRR
jgi:hypothetical protein